MKTIVKAVKVKDGFIARSNKGDILLGGKAFCSELAVYLELLLTYDYMIYQNKLKGKSACVTLIG